MESMESLKLFIDIGFTLTVLYLCFRAAKGNKDSALSSSSVREIEQSLKTVISEAEDSGRELTKELNKRQRGLEQILFDLETIEAKIGRASDHADERISELQQLLSENIPSQKQDHNEVKESSEQIEAEEMEVMADDSSKYNIFGELISLDEAVVRTPLTSQIEIERDNKRDKTDRTNPAPSLEHNIGESKNKIQQIYNKARDLLASGQEVGAVVAATKLPRSKVEELRAAIEWNKEPVIQRRDPKLGVLGSMRRSVEIL